MEDFNSKYTGEEVEQLLDDVSEVVGEDGYVYSNGEKVDMRFTRSLLPVGTAIPANANLNTITYLKIGKYYCSLNVDAQTITNCPTSEAFSMEVFNPLGTNVDDETTREYTYRVRVLTAYKTGMQYIQYCATSGTAGSWNYNSWSVVPQTSFAIASDKNGGSAVKGGSTRGIYIDQYGKFQQMGYTIAKNVPSNAVFTDTNTKVTDVGNHYAPAEDDSVALNAPDGEVIVGLKRDAAGHIVGITTTPSNSGGGGETLTEEDIAAMGFTKNEGTITEVKINGVSKGTSGVVDLGEVPTKEQFDSLVNTTDGINEDVAALYDNKQDTITDLADIRSGAAKGATALQASDVDSEMSDSSTNPIQNKAVSRAFMQLIEEVDLALQSKQNSINDIQTIREGASMGATAVQPSSLADVATSGSYNDLVDKPTFKTINGESIFGSGDITIEGGGGSGDGGAGVETLIYESGINELILEEMQPNKKYRLYLDVLNADGTISIGSFQRLGDGSDLFAEYFAVIDILYEGDRGSSYSGTITLELPDVDIKWANGVPPTLDIGRYELSITCVSDAGFPYYNAVLTPFKSI